MRGRITYKGELGQFVDLKGGIGEKEEIPNYLAFQPIYRCFKKVAYIASGNHIYFWKSKGLFDENGTAPTTSDYSLNTQLSYFVTKTRVELKESCLKQDKITYDY